jgi:hypothetical protein
LHLVHLAPAAEPGKEFLYRHEPAFLCGQLNDPARCNQSAVAADGSTGRASRQLLCLDPAASLRRCPRRAIRSPSGAGICSHEPGKGNPPFGGVVLGHRGWWPSRCTARCPAAATRDQRAATVHAVPVR